MALRAYNTVWTRCTTNTSGFYIHIEINETEVDYKNNTSKVQATARILGRGYSRDGYSGTGAWTSGPSKTMTIYYNGSNIGSGSWSQGGTSSGGSAFGCPTLNSSVQTVTHDSDGTKTITMSVSLTGTNSSYAPNNTSVSVSLTLTPIPRPSAITVENIESAVTSNTSNFSLNVSKYVDTYTDKVCCFVNQEQYDNYVSEESTECLAYIGPDISGEDVLQITSTNKVSILTNADIVEGTTDTYKLIFATFTYNDDDELIGNNSVNATITFTDLVPTVSLTTFSDTKAYSLTNDNHKCVNGISSYSIEYTITCKPGTVLSNATIGSTRVDSIDSTNPLSQKISLTNSKQNNLSLTVMDNRGNTITYSNPITSVINYIDLTAVGSSKRHTATDGELEIIISGYCWDNASHTLSFGSETNETIFEYRVLNSSDSVVTNWTRIPSSGITYNTATSSYRIDYTTSTSGLYDYKEIYKLNFRASDKVHDGVIENKVILPTKVIGKGIPVISWTEHDFYVGETGTDAKIYLNGEELSGGGGEFTPIGSITQWPTDTPPDGWLICDGRAVSRTAYDKLYEVIGTTYGAGDGSTTFNVPDLRGRIAVGMDDGTFNSLGAIGGSEKHTHLFGFRYGGYYRNTALEANGTAIGLTKYNEDGTYTLSGGGTGVGSSTLSAHAHNSYSNVSMSVYHMEGNTSYESSLQPYIVVNFIIKYTQVSSEPLPKEAGIPIGTVLDFTGTEEEIPAGYAKYDDFSNEYKSGDIIDINSDDLSLPGFLTNSNTVIIFNIFVGKSLAKVNSFTATIVKANIRPATGGYLGTSGYVDGGYDFLSICTSSVSKASDYILCIHLQKSSSFGSTNNTPVSVGQGRIQIRIN